MPDLKVEHDGGQLAHAALGLLGTPFRLHGRDPATGLDCVGVVGAALNAIGRPVRLPQGYALRQAEHQHFQPFLADAGFRPLSAAHEAGDVLIVRPAACQLHVLVAAGIAAFVHAHAGLRRVVLSPLQAEWRILSQWRLTRE